MRLAHGFDREMQDVYGGAMARCKVFVFVLLNERRQNLEPVAISGSGHWLGLEITGYFADSPLVVLFIVERLYVHHHVVSALLILIVRTHKFDESDFELIKETDNKFIRTGYRPFSPKNSWAWPNTLYWRKDVK